MVQIKKLFGQKEQFWFKKGPSKFPIRVIFIILCHGKPKRPKNMSKKHIRPVHPCNVLVDVVFVIRGRKIFYGRSLSSVERRKTMMRAKSLDASKKKLYTHHNKDINGAKMFSKIRIDCELIILFLCEM